MAKKGDRRNKKDPNGRGNKGSVMSGDDTNSSKRISKPNIHDPRTIQKNKSNKT